MNIAYIKIDLKNHTKRTNQIDLLVKKTLKKHWKTQSKMNIRVRNLKKWNKIHKHMQLPKKHQKTNTKCMKIKNEITNNYHSKTKKNTILKIHFLKCHECCYIYMPRKQ